MRFNILLLRYLATSRSWARFRKVDSVSVIPIDRERLRNSADIQLIQRCPETRKIWFIRYPFFHPAVIWLRSAAANPSVQISFPIPYDVTFRYLLTLKGSSVKCPIIFTCDITSSSGWHSNQHIHALNPWDRLYGRTIYVHLFLYLQTRSAFLIRFSSFAISHSYCTDLSVSDSQEQTSKPNSLTARSPIQRETCLNPLLDSLTN